MTVTWQAPQRVPTGGPTADAGEVAIRLGTAGDGRRHSCGLDLLTQGMTHIASEAEHATGRRRAAAGEFADDESSFSLWPGS